MCDVQIFRQQKTTWFAKNSDRDASEPQVVVRLDATRGDTAGTVATTYLDIPQTANRYGVILSKPNWIWGAEMGTNDQGVTIGNTAVFSKLVNQTPGLIGMDLLRLGLERGSNAEHALTVITEHLEHYGQGGPCGYRDKKFIYDNSFLIADPDEAWVLETAGRNWVARKIDQSWAISNCMTIGEEFDRSSSGIEDEARKLGYLKKGSIFSFTAAFETNFMPLASGARSRIKSSKACLDSADLSHSISLAILASHLRHHGRGSVTNKIRHNYDVCMHAGHTLTRPSKTTGSMISRLGKSHTHLVTGTSTPCMSVFRPVGFSEIHNANFDESAERWYDHESVHRRAELGLLDYTELRRSAIETTENIFALIEQESDIAAADRLADTWQSEWTKRAQAIPWKYNLLSSKHRYWRRLNNLDGIS